MTGTVKVSKCEWVRKGGKCWSFALRVFGVEGAGGWLTGWLLAVR